MGLWVWLLEMPWECHMSLDQGTAVAGGLAGIMYGCGGTRGIPDEWIKQIPKRQWIADLCEAVEHIH